MKREKSFTAILTNAQFARYDRDFRRYCKRRGIPPTKKQASKYRNGRGQAARERRGLP